MKRLHTINQRPAHTQGCGGQPLLVMSGIGNSSNHGSRNNGARHWSSMILSSTMVMYLNRGLRVNANLSTKISNIFAITVLANQLRQRLQVLLQGFKSFNCGFDYQLDISAILGAVEPEHPRWSGWCRFNLAPM